MAAVTLTHPLLLLQALYFIVGFSRAAVIPSENFTGSVSLVDNDVYHLFWKYDTTTITFEVHAKVLGWVGFGLSPNGGMPSSDIVIGWVKNGVPYFHDRYATAKAMPVIDTIQDWTLLAASETATHTVLKFTRPLSLCDADDRSITSGTMRVIFAYSDSDPSSEDAVLYHNSNRGTMSMQFLTLSSTKAQSLPSDAFHVDLLNKNVTIDHSSDTFYWCEGYVAPNMTGKNHLIKVEPIIQAGNEAHVHHFILYACFHTPTNITSDNIGFNCQTPNMPWGECIANVVAWAIGGTSYDFPAHVGMPFGDTANKVLYLRMETHYDNPSLTQGIVDASGMRLWFTPTLRQYDAGIIRAGIDVNPFGHILPGGYSAFTSSGHCASECLAEAMGSTVPDIKVFSTNMHTHLLGTGVRVRHFKDGIEKPTLDEDMTYDFNLQETRFVSPEVTVSRGDNLVVECIYDTASKTYATVAGLGTPNEMCMAFLYYYPALNFSECASIPTQSQLAEGLSLNYVPYNTNYYQFALLTDHSNTPFHRYLSTLGKFSDEATKEKYQRAVNTGKIQLGCTQGQTALQSHKRVIEVPEITSTYTAPFTCGNISGASYSIKSSSLVVSILLVISAIVYGVH